MFSLCFFVGAAAATATATATVAAVVLVVEHALSSMSTVYCIFLSMTGGRYINSVRNVPRVARYLARFIRFLIENGVDMENIHLIGFSLGAEVAGFAGKTLKEWNLELPRITGEFIQNICWSA